MIESRGEELKGAKLAQQGVIARPESNRRPPAKGFTRVRNFKFRVAGMNGHGRSADASNAARPFIIDRDTQRVAKLPR